MIPPCLTPIRYVSRVKWSNPGKGVALSLLHLGVEVIEKGTFWSPSSTVANLLTYLCDHGTNCMINVMLHGLAWAFDLGLCSKPVDRHSRSSWKKEMINTFYYLKFPFLCRRWFHFQSSYHKFIIGGFGFNRHFRGMLDKK